LADQVLPFRDASDGVEAVMGKRSPVLRFGPQAAKLYRPFAGRKVSVGCGRTVETDDNGSVVTIDVNHDLTTLEGGGYAGTEMRLPRNGARVVLPFDGEPYDLCYLATPERRTDEYCLKTTTAPVEAPCVRVLVALTDAGRARVGDPTRRLTRAFGADIAMLDHPDAVPAPGKVGVYIDATTRVVAVILRDGSRKFVRWVGDVYSTNVAEFTGSSEDVIRLP
jgi:hypothetical protein